MKNKKYKKICASWDCREELIEDGSLSLKCPKCDRKYWKDEILWETK